MAALFCVLNYMCVCSVLLQVMFLISLFIMCIFLLAEYTTIGTIFSAFVGTVDWVIILIIGLLTMSYTAYG